MNFDEAIQAHSQWKLRLTLFVNGSSNETMDPAVIGVDDRCALGQWIHGEGSQHSNHAEYADLVKEHAAFHKAAADVIRLVGANQAKAAQLELEPNGKFYDASLRTISAIRHLRNKVQQNA